MGLPKFATLALSLLLLPLVTVGQQTTTETTTETNQDNVVDESIDKSGLALEPMLIYTSEDASIRTGDLPIISDDTSATATGGGVGLKIGGHVAETLVLGVDARYSRNEFQDSSYGDTEADKYTVGPTIGLQMPVAGLRLWATGVLVGGYDLEAGNLGFDVRFRDPSGYRVGAGIHVGAFSINVEYEDLEFDETVIESVGGADSDAVSGVNFDTKGYQASISFPMEL